MHFLQLGSAANLLLGLRPEWRLAAPPRQPFVLFDVDVRARGVWQEPALSLHENADDLLDAIFDFRVLPFQLQRTPFHVPPSALMRHELAPGAHYLLVKMRREDADFLHEGVRGGIGRPIQIQTYWTDEGRHAMGRLRTSERVSRGDAREAAVTTRQARRYLDYGYDFGTHFVSRIVVGDLAVQVFACEPARYRHMKEAFGSMSVSGALARSFALFTRPEWSVPVFATSASGDPRFTAFDLSTTNPASLPIDAIAPVTIALTPQTSFMEVYRASAFRRVVEGAMLHRYRSRVRFPIAQTGLRVPDEFTFPSGFSMFLRELPPVAGKLFAYRASPRLIDGELPSVPYDVVTQEMEGGLFIDRESRETLFEGLRFAGDQRVELREEEPLPPHAFASDIRRTLDYAEVLLRHPSSTPEEVAFASGYLTWLALTPPPPAQSTLPRPAPTTITSIAHAAARLAIELRHGVAPAALDALTGRVNSLLAIHDDRDYGDDVITAKWRLVQALARLEHHLGVPPAPKLELAALAQSISRFSEPPVPPSRA